MANSQFDTTPERTDQDFLHLGARRALASCLGALVVESGLISGCSQTVQVFQNGLLHGRIPEVAHMPAIRKFRDL